MRAGTLRKSGTLQRRAAGARDEYGGQPPVWNDVAPVRYSIQTTAGREIESAGNVRAVATSTVTMRYRSDVQPGMRIKADATQFEDERYFNITAVNDVNQLHHELEVTVVEDRTATA